MKGLTLMLLFIVVLTNEYVESAQAGGNSLDKDCPQSICSNVAVYAMGAVIGLLIAVIVSLLAYIYQLKHSKAENLDDELHITGSTSSQKYERHVSTETSDVTYKTEISNDSKRLLSRQPSKLTILDYPDNSLSRLKLNEDMPTVTTPTSKPLRPYGQHRAQIEDLCQEILKKAAKNSSNVTKILNAQPEESDEEENQNLQKSVSTQFLDLDDNIEVYPSPSQVKKLQKFPALNSNNAENTNEQKKNIKLPFLTAKLSNTGSSSANEVNNLSKLPENSTGPALNFNKFNKNDDELDPPNHEDQDEVYDDLPKITRPVTLNENSIDEMYDNPSNIPIVNRSSADTKENDKSDNDFYDSVPCKQPVHSDKEHIEDIYENQKSNKPILDKASDANLKPTTNTVNDNGDNEDYDLPRRHGRGIVITEDSASGYLLPLTDESEPCFHAFYSNAKSFNENLK